MERTKETLEARVRETPLVDRLKECQKRIGNMCAELRGPKMSIPVEYYDDDFYICTTLADAQATVEALQALIKQMGEQAAVLAKDGMAAKAQVEALQRERDTARRRVDELEAREVDVVLLRDDIDAERHENMKQIEELRQQVGELQREKDEANEVVEALASKVAEQSIELNGDPQNFHGRGRTIGLRASLSQLQALVRALPVYAADTLITVDGDLDEIDRPALRSAVMELLEYRATLSATPTAPVVPHEPYRSGPDTYADERQTIRDERDRLQRALEQVSLHLAQPGDDETPANQYVPTAAEIVTCQRILDAALTPAGKAPRDTK